MLKLRAITVGLFVFIARLHIAPGNDMIWPLCYARHLPNPYPACQRGDFPADMLPVGLLVYPFAGMSDTVAAALVLGLSVGLLTAALGTRWPVLFSLPMVTCLVYAQWAPLILACTLLPRLLPLILVKPHLGMAAFVRGTWAGRALVVGGLLLSLIVLPAWPLIWLGAIGHYDGYVPILACPLLVFSPPVLLLAALSPQRGIYDALLSASALRGRRAAAIWACCTWLYLIFAPAIWAIPLCTYLPALLLAPPKHR